MTTKALQLAALAVELDADESLPLRESNLVFGEGNPDTEVLFIGEAPGFYENELKRPFVGRSGQLLDKLMAELGWRRADVYITNIVKRRPPDNRDPLPLEIEAYRPYLARQIEIISPVVVATLGRFAMNYFLPLHKITRDQGKLFPINPPHRQSGRLFLYPLFHPAAALRSTDTLNDLRDSFKKFPAVIAKCRAALAEPEIKPQPRPPTQARLL